MSDTEDAADMACELAYVLCELALADGADANALMMGASWTMADDGSVTLKSGSYSGTFSPDDIAAAMSDEEAEEPAEPADGEAAA